MVGMQYDHLMGEPLDVASHPDNSLSNDASPTPSMAPDILAAAAASAAASAPPAKKAKKRKK